MTATAVAIISENSTRSAFMSGWRRMTASALCSACTAGMALSCLASELICPSWRRALANSADMCASLRLL